MTTPTSPDLPELARLDLALADARREIERLRGLLGEACECLPGANEGNRFHAQSILKRAALKDAP